MNLKSQISNSPRLLRTLFAVFALARFVGAQATQPAVSPSNPPIASPSVASIAQQLVAAANQQAAAAVAQQQAADAAALNAANQATAAALAQVQQLQTQIAQLRQPTTRPVTESWYPSPVLNLAVDERIYVDADHGSDTAGNGSQASPFRTNGAAFSRAKNDMASGASKHPGVYDFAPATQPYDPLPPNGIEWTRYGNTDPEQRPKVAITDTGAIFINAMNFSMHDLEFDGPDPSTGSGQAGQAPAAPANYGFYANGATNVYITDNVFRNVTQGVVIIGGGTNVHVANNALAGGWTPKIGNSMMCSAVYNEHPDLSLDHNLLYHWGYLEGWDFTNPTYNNGVMFFHGEYLNPAGGWIKAPKVHHEFAWSCASTGIQGRTSGSNIDSCLFICNGHDVDAFVGVGYDQTLHDGKTWDVETPGSISNCVVLGTQRNAAPDWAGGLGLYCRGTITGCRFLSGSTFQLNAAIQVRQNNAPYAADYSATIANCDGIWPFDVAQGRPAVSIDPNLPANSLTQTNVTIRQPRPGEHVPNIYDYVAQFGVAPNEHDASEWFITHRHSCEASTEAALKFFQSVNVN